MHCVVDEQTDNTSNFDVNTMETDNGNDSDVDNDIDIDNDIDSAITKNSQRMNELKQWNYRCKPENKFIFLTYLGQDQNTANSFKRFAKRINEIEPKNLETLVDIKTQTNFYCNGN